MSTPTLDLEPLRLHLREVSTLALEHVTSRDLSSVLPLRGSDAYQTWNLLLSEVGNGQTRETILCLVRQEEQRREQLALPPQEGIAALITRLEEETFAEPASDYAPPPPRPRRPPSGRSLKVGPRISAGWPSPSCGRWRGTHDDGDHPPCPGE